MKRLNIGLSDEAFDKLKIFQKKLSCNADTAIDALLNKLTRKEIEEWEPRT